MREKYESLSLATLKDLAKARGLKGVSALRKPELIERMLHEDELEGETKKQETVREKQQQSEVEGNGERILQRMIEKNPVLQKLIDDLDLVLVGASPIGNDDEKPP